MPPLSRDANVTSPPASVVLDSTRRCPSRQSKRQSATSAPATGVPVAPERTRAERAPDAVSGLTTRTRSERKRFVPTTTLSEAPKSFRAEAATT